MSCITISVLPIMLIKQYNMVKYQSTTDKRPENRQSEYRLPNLVYGPPSYALLPLAASAAQSVLSLLSSLLTYQNVTSVQIPAQTNGRLQPMT